MGTLYELTSDWLAVSAMLSDPDIDPQAVADTLESIECSLSDKADGYAKIIANYKADIAGLDAEIRRMKRLKAHYEKVVIDLKRRLADSMKATVGKKMRTGLFSFAVIENTPRVDAPDVDMLPPEYVRTAVTREPDRTKIKEAIAAGVAVPGAVLVPSERLDIK